jgi:hypothetical protein
VKKSEDLLDALELRSMLAVGSMGTVYNATLYGQRIVCKVRSALQAMLMNDRPMAVWWFMHAH